MSNESGPHREQGFALVMVLWAAIIMALIAGSILRMSHTEAQISHNVARLAELRAAAEGAIAVVELELLTPDVGAQLRLDGTPFQMTVSGFAVQATIQDQTGLIDLNAAPGAILRHLIETTGGADTDTAQVLADRIMDWREPGPGKRLNGAKAEDYLAAGIAYGPRSAPFATVQEVQLVLGMTPVIAGRIMPLLTVASQNPTVDLQVAPRDVMLALPGLDEDSVATILGQRDARWTDRTSTLAAPVASPIGRAMAITATARGLGSMSVESGVVVRLTGFSANPLWIYRAY